MLKHLRLTSQGKEALAITLNVYEGFSSHTDLCRAMAMKGYPQTTYAGIRLFSQFYAVAFDGCAYGDMETAENLMVVGKNTAWKTTEEGYLTRGFTPCLPAPENRRNHFCTTPICHNLQIHRDLSRMDPKLRLYRYSGKKTSVRDSTDCEYAEGYISLLGRTFYASWITKAQISQLEPYFDPHSLISAFQGKIKLENGSVVDWNPFNGAVDEKDYCQAMKKSKILIDPAAFELHPLNAVTFEVGDS